MSTRLRAVVACRTITRSFIDGGIDYAEFRAQMASAMGPLDPLDWALEELDDATGAEAKMYVEWLGGEFGESEGRIPAREGWKYGESQEPYGWVDQDEYRNRLREVLARILEDT